MSKLKKQYPPLEHVVTPTVPTAQAAFYLNRKPQTLRIWSYKESGPIQPLKIGRRCAWPTKELKKLLGVGYERE